MLNRKTTSVHSQEHWSIEWKAGCEFEYLNILLCLAHQAHYCRFKMCKGSWSSFLILTIRFNSSLVWGLNCCLRRNFGHKCYESAREEPLQSTALCWDILVTWPCKCSCDLSIAAWQRLQQELNARPLLHKYVPSNALLCYPWSRKRYCANSAAGLSNDVALAVTIIECTKLIKGLQIWIR